MYNSKTILFFGAILALCNSAAIYKKITEKCVLSDDKCQQLLYGNILKEVSENGIPEFDIPKVDPYEVKDVEIIALGMVKITMKDGTIAGFKTCKSNSFTTDVKTHRTQIELVCEFFSFEGHYTAESTPTLMALLDGFKIHGDGKAKLVVENLKMNLDFPLAVKKLDDGELHFRIIPEDATSSFEVLGKASIDVDGIFIGNQDVSAVAANIFNENYQSLTKTLGSTFIDAGLKVFYKQVTKFFDAVPAKDLICDDLSPFVKN